MCWECTLEIHRCEDCDDDWSCDCCNEHVEYDKKKMAEKEALSDQLELMEYVFELDKAWKQNHICTNDGDYSICKTCIIKRQYEIPEEEEEEEPDDCAEVYYDKSKRRTVTISAGRIKYTYDKNKLTNN